MRFIKTFILSAFLSSAFAQTGDFDKISPVLAEEMKENSEAYIPVTIVLKDQVDVDAMYMDFINHNTPIHDRAVKVVTSLENKAKATQGEILDFLEGSKGVDQATVASLWIINGFSASLNSEAIEALSQRDDIKMIENAPINYFFENEAPEAEAFLVPNGSEQGLIQMNVDKLWALGYTGAGRLSMIIDSGVEWQHPAISAKYQGLYFDESQSYRSGGTEPEDCQGHGTSVAGCVLGLDRMTNDTIGSAFNARWIDASATISDNEGNLCDYAQYNSFQQLQYALNPDGDSNTTDDIPDVINNSYGTNHGSCLNSGAFAGAITNLAAAGVATLWAAGNDGPDPSTTGQQADINLNLVRTFSVGAVDRNANIADFSSRGPSACVTSENSLNIKPEVVARGSSVRTCGLDGSYVSISGTSFATPYASGVALLLKEAFPNLSGEDILMAMYLTATDLGVEGEDNNYGNGLVDAFAAYEYLIEQGNEPADPTVENDVIAVGISAESEACGDGSYTATFHLENGGTANLTSATVNIEYIQSGVVVATNSIEWTGNLATKERSTIQIPAQSNIGGDLRVLVSLSNPNGVADAKPYNNKYRKEIRVLQQEEAEVVAIGGDTPCRGSNTRLTVQSPDAEVVAVNWYTSAFSTLVISEDPVYEFSFGGNFTLYADPVFKVTNGGIANINDYTTEYSSSNSGVQFDLLADTKIISTKVYAESAGASVFRIQNNRGTTLKTVNVTLQEGENTIVWNMDLQAGNGYRMVKFIGNTLAYAPLASNEDLSLPISIGSAIYITSSVNGNTSSYDYFYGWDVEYTGVCGRISKAVSFSGSNEDLEPAFEPTIDNNVVNFNNTGSTATGYFWDFGDGTTSTEENPTHTYENVGTYEVIQQLTTSNGCTVNNYQTVQIDIVSSNNEIEAGQYIDIYPNPTSDILNINFSFENQSTVGIKLVDVTGKTIYQANNTSYRDNEVKLDINEFPSGVYYLVFQLEEGNVVRKVVKTN